MRYSFIIPAYNEQRDLGQSLQSIRDQMRPDDPYEIIVVDNASTDATADIARQHDVDLVSLPQRRTISAARNLGVDQSSGEVLIFIDGDVYLHATWREHLPPVIERVIDDTAIAGSVYAVDPAASWVARVWFTPLFEQQQRVTFINGGHLLVTRWLFDSLCGFDEAFETGEDHEFCERARRHGAEVFNDKQLIAVHLGYPNTLSHFFRRERWHGKGNFMPLSRIFASKIPPAVLALLAALLCSILVPVLSGWWPAVLIYPVFAMVLTAMSAYLWLGGFRGGFFRCMFLAWLYFTARGMALFDVLGERFFARRAKVT